MLRDGRIWMGTGKNGPVSLLPSLANRHGLIAGATGTGKTVSLKVLAEGFSDLGVPVFLSDIKSDLSGMVKPGTGSDSIFDRMRDCGMAHPETDFHFHAYPTVFWDVYGEPNCRPVRSTVESMGDQLLSRMLGLNDTQSGVMNIVFRYARKYGYPLMTLQDLKSLLRDLGGVTKELTLEFGNVSVASIGAIQRAVAMLEDQGGTAFFQAPELNVMEWMQTDAATGRGVINILNADRLFQNPLMYSTFLLWMLTKLYDGLPEIGDPEKPRIVFFFDEAHLLFEDCSKILLSKIEQTVRLIRSKGVGVYFITQSPADIPMDILGQLGNRIQHALRAYTPLDQKAVRVAAQTFRTNPDFKTEEAITTLKTGEALVSFLDENGAPGVVDRVTILPPQSHMGAVPEEDRRSSWPAPAAGVPVVNAGFGQPVSAAPVLDTAAVDVPPAMDSSIPGTPGADAQVAPDGIQFPVYSTTPQQARVSAAVNAMSQTFKVYDPTTGQYKEQELPQMTEVQQAAQPVVQQVQQVAQPVVQAAQQYVQQGVDAAGQPIYQAVAQPVYQAPVYPDPQPAVQQLYQQPATPVAPVMQPVMTTQDAPQAAQPVPTIQIQPAIQQMPVMVLDPTTGQYVQQMMTMQQDPATGNWVPVQAPVTTDPIALAKQQEAMEKARKEAEKAEKEAAKAAKEQEAAERRARNDQLREEAAERARKNDSVAGRIKNTAISSATRQVTNTVTKKLIDSVSNLFEGGTKKK